MKHIKKSKSLGIFLAILLISTTISCPLKAEPQETPQFSSTRAIAPFAALAAIITIGATILLTDYLILLSRPGR